MPWSDSARPHRCRCGKQYSNLGTMVRHQREECGRDPHHCCQLCNYRSHRKDTLDRHVRLKHQKMPEIVQVVMNHYVLGCVKQELFDCGKEDPRQLLPPTSVLSRPHQCPRCLKAYLKPCTLRRHITFECGVSPQFHCPYCDHKAKRNDELNKHIFRRHNILNDKRGTLNV
ncbi:hypothetical protein J6590_014934 [Homalodisca vitripennis]|nr:hypothetical protein J6590_014934 [Homalodisca vitripennis]